MSELNLQRPVIAAFDFDGTLTHRDTSLPFIVFGAGKAKTMRHFVMSVPGFLADLGVSVWREAITRRRVLGSVLGCWEGRVHERMLRRAFAGVEGDKLMELGARFAEDELDRFLRAGGVERVRWHREHGHRCVLISASVDVYLRPWAQAIGFDEVLGTELEMDERGAFTGHFAGEPCWGAAKVRRLTTRFGSRESFTLVAYGDGRGDDALLATADEAYRIGDRLSFASMARGNQLGSP